jgi:hypothetical protein
MAHRSIQKGLHICEYKHVDNWPVCISTCSLGEHMICCVDSLYDTACYVSFEESKKVLHRTFWRTCKGCHSIYRMVSYLQYAYRDPFEKYAWYITNES